MNVGDAVPVFINERAESHRILHTRIVPHCIFNVLQVHPQALFNLVLIGSLPNELLLVHRFLAWWRLIHSRACNLGHLRRGSSSSFSRFRSLDRKLVSGIRVVGRLHIRNSKRTTVPRNSASLRGFRSSHHTSLDFLHVNFHQHRCRCSHTPRAPSINHFLLRELFLFFELLEFLLHLVNFILMLLCERRLEIRRAVFELLQELAECRK
mmetsp:Transcript_11010/g.23588  ORF Transcript_11010/g.23588 Transcript_11010/m.23588 type:complete len:209 (-) Transcript_11010:493-1119(-)